MGRRVAVLHAVDGDVSPCSKGSCVWGVQDVVGTLERQQVKRGAQVGGEAGEEEAERPDVNGPRAGRSCTG